MSSELLVIKNVNVVNYYGVKKHCDVICKNGKIVEVASHNLSRIKSITRKYKQAKIVNGKGYYLLPGFINIHTHGVDMFNVMDENEESIVNMAKETVKYGVTTFLPTIMTSTIDKMIAIGEIIYSAMRVVNKNSCYAEVIGAHFEGPFINPVRSGAQDKNLVSFATHDNIKHLYEKSKDVMKLITIAPEIDGGFDAVKFLSSNGVIVSCGHTDATFADMKKAYDNGARSATHLFNAMRPLHHREPGIIGFVLTEKEYYAEIIPDGIHVSEVLVSLLIRLKPDHLIFVTDTMIGPQVSTEKYVLDGREIFIKGDKLTLSDGTIAGSMLGFDKGVKNVFSWCQHITLCDIVKLSSYNAAKLLGINRYKGAIEKNKDADFVILSDKLELMSTIKKGNISFLSKGFSMSIE